MYIQYTYRRVDEFIFMHFLCEQSKKKLCVDFSVVQRKGTKLPLEQHRFTQSHKRNNNNETSYFSCKCAFKFSSFFSMEIISCNFHCFRAFIFMTGFIFHCSFHMRWYHFSDNLDSFTIELWTRKNCSAQLFSSSTVWENVFSSVKNYVSKKR